MAYERILAALSDPTRRSIVQQLRAGPMPVGRLARGLPVSRPAVSQHLKVLSDAGLVTAEAVGTQRLYRLAPAGLRPLRDWIDSLWDDALANCARAAEEEARREMPE